MLWSRVERHECFDGWDKVIGYSAADAPICQLNDVLGRAIGDRTAFQDLAVDADIANNASGWQWVAGSGADASPYFRIFNPVTQAQKFDGDGEYIKRWVPELSRRGRALGRAADRVRTAGVPRRRARVR